MSVLVLLILTVGYNNIHVSEAKEDLSLTDFLLDFLLSLWVPQNYAPSKFTRSIHDPTTKEQMISIEKSKMALDNYINHLLRYARENSYKNGKPPSMDSNSINHLPCNNPEHQPYYPEYEPFSSEGDEGRRVIYTPYDLPSQLYDSYGDPSNVFPIYGNSNKEDTNISGNKGILTGLNACPPSDTISPQPYIYGCQSKRDATFNEGIFQAQLPNSPDMHSRRLFETAKQIWYLNHNNPPKISLTNRYYDQHHNRLESLNADLPKTPSPISARHLISPQENFKIIMPSSNSGAKDVDARSFEELYLPGFLNELVKKPVPSKNLVAPRHNLPRYSNNYNDLTDAVVANRMLDEKLGPPGSVLGTIGFDNHKSLAQPTKVQERRIEKKSVNSSSVVSPTHRFGELNSKSSNNGKEITGRTVKTTKTSN